MHTLKKNSELLNSSYEGLVRNFKTRLSPEPVAWFCNPAARRLKLLDGLRLGVLFSAGLC